MPRRTTDIPMSKRPKNEAIMRTYYIACFHVKPNRLFTAAAMRWSENTKTDIKSPHLC